MLRVFVLLLAGFVLVAELPAATFTVENLFDDVDAPDVSPGDGVCADNFGTCTFRAAIMEANALGSDDAIEFSVSGTITVSAAVGPFPVITDFIIIDGTTAPGFNSAGETLLAAPPVVLLNGNALTGSTADGLRFSGGGAAFSEIYSIAIVNFPDNGVEVLTGTDSLIFQGNSISGNADAGLFAINSDFLVIGQIYGIFTNEFIGLGNLISSNGADGLVLSNSDSNQVFTNFIGILADGATAASNGGNGITLVGDNNLIGFGDDDESGGNIIANNSGTGITLIGSGNTIQSNRIGLGAADGFFGNAGNGISLTGTNNRIGAMGNNRGNDIANNSHGILAGVTGGASAPQTIIENNRVGISFAELGNALDGIRIENGDDVQILNNSVVNNRNGIWANTSNNIIRGNTVGVVGSNRLGNSEHGIFLSTDAMDNQIGGPNAEHANVVGDNGANVAPFFHGIEVRGSGHEVTGNFIGVTPSGQNVGQPSIGLVLAAGLTEVTGNVIGNNAIGINVGGANHTLSENYIGTTRSGGNIGNSSDGIFLAGNNAGLNVFIGINNIIAYNGRFGIFGNAVPGQGGIYNIIGNTIVQNDNAGMALPFTGDNGRYFVQFNRLALNGNNGIFVFGSDSRTTISSNTMQGNNGIAIDVNGGGMDANDPGDADTGPNRLMNSPEIITSVFMPGSPPMLSVDFRVDASSANAAYPITVQAFWTDREEPMQGRFFITSTEYPTAQLIQNVVYTLPNGTTGGRFAMTATDDDGNTSEMSAAVDFGVIETLLKDGFETFSSGFRLR